MDETCPKCGAHFPADQAWANRTITGLLVSPALQDLDTRVRCPSCATVFPAVEFRFFGFIPPKVLKVSLMVFVGVMVITAVIFLFGEP